LRQFRHSYEKPINQLGNAHLNIALDLNKTQKASKPFQSEEYGALTLFYVLSHKTNQYLMPLSSKLPIYQEKENYYDTCASHIT